MKLQSMTDFVLSVVNADRPCDRGKMLDEIGLYAEFLKQPLKLEMFVTCDDEGNVLKYPVNNGVIESHVKLKKYEKAKEKVLFEHIKRLSYNPVDKSIELYDYKNNHLFFIEENETIEHLVEYNLQLTPNAIKQSGL